MYERVQILFLSLIWFQITAAIIPMNFLVGSIGELRCSSSFPPPWSKSGIAGGYRIIGLNGKKHPNFNEPRFVFYKDANEYVIKISDIRLVDAGRFVCEGDTSTSYLVTIIG